MGSVLLAALNEFAIIPIPDNEEASGWKLSHLACSWDSNTQWEGDPHKVGDVIRWIMNHECKAPIIGVG